MMPSPVGESGNIGIAHRWCGTCAIDVDDYLAATAWLSNRGIALEGLLAATDSVQISSGRPNRAKLLYRLPDGVPWLPLIPALGKGFELRCAAKDGASTVTDVLPPSIHELTHKPYVWAGLGDWRDPPELPAKLLALWRELAKNGTKKAAGHSEGASDVPGRHNAPTGDERVGDLRGLDGGERREVRPATPGCGCRPHRQVGGAVCA